MLTANTEADDWPPESQSTGFTEDEQQVRLKLVFVYHSHNQLSMFLLFLLLSCNNQEYPDVYLKTELVHTVVGGTVLLMQPSEHG